MPKNKQSKENPPKTPLKKGKRSEPEGGGEEGCRCKEVAKKTPGELLKVAIEDLTFWKKKK